MSTSLLYHAFGIRGYESVRTDHQEGRVIFTILQEPKPAAARSAGGCEVRPHGHVERRFRSLPIGGRATFVDLPVSRVECRVCRGGPRDAEALPAHTPERPFLAASSGRTPSP